MPRRADLATFVLVAVLTFLGGLVLSALAGLLSPAHGAVKYLSTSGSATWAAAANPGTPCNLTTVNANIAGGDTVYAADGSYGEFKPNNNGTSSAWMTLLGNSADSTAVTFSNYQALSGTFPNGKGDWTRLRWVTLTNLDLGSKGVGSGGVHRGPYGIRITNSRIDDSSVNIMGSEILIEDCDVPSATTFGADNNNGPSLYYSNLITINRCRFSGSKSGTGDWQFLKTAHTRNFSFTNNSVTMTNSQSSGYGFIIEMYKTRFAAVTDNTIVYVNNAGGGAGTQMVYTTRDSTQDVDFMRNRVFVSGSKPVGLRNAHNGSFDYAPNHRWIGNLIKVANPPGEGAVRLERPTDNLVFSGNVIFSGGAQPALSAHSGVYSGVNNLFRHNTLAAANAQVVDLAGTGTWTTSKWVGNLVYSTVANSASAGGATLRLASAIESDSLGLVFTPLGTSGNAIYKGSLGAPGSGGGFGQSGKAVWGSPRFVDSTYASFDAGISQTGYADDVKSPSLQDGFAGAFSDSLGGSTGTTDTSPPSAVEDLAVAGQSTTNLDLEWTSPDDDGTGTGSAAVYDIRYSTSNITEGNWASASQFTGEPTPLPFDNTTSWSTPNVLSPGTLYYVALKSRDEAGNESALSNIATGTTTAVVDSIAALRIVTKDDVAGIVFDYAFDADTNATVRVFYGVAAATDTAHAPARRPGSARTYATSLFGLTPGTTYQVAIVTSDGARKDTIVTTRPASWWLRTQTGPSVYVSPGGNDANDGLTSGAPKRTISAAWSALLARPNQGRGGAVVLLDGVFYQRHSFTGSSGVPDTGYFLRAANPGGAIVDGADERLINGHTTLTWNAVNAAADPERIGVGGAQGDTLFSALYLPADSLDGLWVDGHAYHRATTLAEVWNKSGSSGGGGYNFRNVSALGHYYMAGDTIYVRARAGTNIRTAAIRAGYRPSLFYVDDPYVQVEGITFRHAGGMNSGNGIALRFRATASANGGTAYRCTFVNNDREGVYAIGSGGTQADSVTIAECTYDGGGTERFGYAAGKSRREEARQLCLMDGTYLTVLRNTVSRGFNGIGLLGIAGSLTAGADCDVTANTISDMADDAIEYEDGCAVNGRVIGNTATRFLHGISIVPVYIGPTFYVRNFLRYPLSGGAAFKLGSGSTGQAFLYHNTAVADTTVVSMGIGTPGGQFWQKTFVNNVLTGKNGFHAGLRNSLSGSDTTGAITNTFNWDLIYASSDTVARWKDGNHYDSTTVRTLIRFETNGIRRLHPAWQDTAAGLWGSVRGADRGRRIAGITGTLVNVVGAAPDIGAFEIDLEAPPAITDLAVTGRGANRVSLGWSSPGDLPGIGFPAAYDVRYSTSAINSGNWASATQAIGAPTPRIAGSPETFTVVGLSLLTNYHFAVRARDLVGNVAALSNVPQASTKRPPEEK